MKSKHLIITGAFGLVGSNICKVLERDYPNIKITKIKFDDIPEYTEMADYIIHAAGYGQPQMFSKDKLKTIEVNTTFTSNLFSYLKPKGTFLFVSTAEVYSGTRSPHRETDIGTTTPQHERACYIEGKRCGEAICMAYKEQGYNVKIARLALAYGPGTKKGDTRVLNQFIEQALTNKKIVMKDTGDAVRTYCYVYDVVKQILSILFEGIDCVYNVGGKSTILIRHLAEMIAEMTGSKVIMGNKSLKGAPSDVILNIYKVTTEFPMYLVGLESGLLETIEYQKELYGV